MRSLLPLLVIAGLDLWAADRPDKSTAEKRLPAAATARTDAAAPAGQTFSRPVSTYAPAVAPEIPVKGGTFSRPQSTFSTPAGSFAHPGPTFATPMGGSTFATAPGSFSRPATFQTPAGSFHRPVSTFSNPTQATSPLPQGAFGSSIRPGSTFAPPPGGITFSRPAIARGETAEAGQETVAAPPVVVDLPPGAKVRKVATKEPPGK